MKVIKTISYKREQTRKRVQRYRGINQILTEQSERIQLNLWKKTDTHSLTNDLEELSEYIEEKKDPKMLKRWAIENNITHRALNDLLKLLVSFGLDFLPMDSRTLLQTPKIVNINEVANGKFWFDGITHNLKRILATINRDMNISLNINIDGLPLFESSKTQMWPILMNVNGNGLSYLINLVLLHSKDVFFQSFQSNVLL